MKADIKIEAEINMVVTPAEFATIYNDVMNGSLLQTDREEALKGVQDTLYSIKERLIDMGLIEPV